MARRRSLPSFAGLRAFDAAARRLSFRQAGEELCVTQSAISHQVRSLEEFLGYRLFRRVRNRIELTAAGERYLEEISPLLDRLAVAGSRAAAATHRERLRIRATPAFAARWLIPRLDGFRDVCSGAQLSLSTGLPPTDFSDGEADVIIHWGCEPVDGAHVEPFFSSSRFPVASPELLRRLGRPKDENALQEFPLLRDRVQDGWPEWFRLAGLASPEQPTAPAFAHCELVLNAAESGVGVALAYGRLVERELRRGSLVRLFERESGPYFIYSVACPEECSDKPLVAAFRDWILAQARSADAYAVGIRTHARA